MDHLNQSLFLMLNGGPQSPALLLALARGLALYGVVAVALWLVLAWVRADGAQRAALLDAVAAALLGLAGVQIIARLWYHPRPFEIGLGHQLMPHAPEASFPSDHATLLFALAFGLMASPPLRRAGQVLIGVALAVSGARVFLGVHFPFDILGGAGLALMMVRLVIRLPRARLWRWLGGVYDGALDLLHLPQRWFRRG